MKILALVSDLMMQSQVAGAAQRTGAEITFALSPQSLATRLEDGTPDLLIVDLSHPGLDPAGLMEQLGPKLSPQTATLAFGPHVHKAKLEAAARSGFSTVLTRGQFHANMDQLLAGNAD
jgi:CheY-like chemotaxis protein